MKLKRTFDVMAMALAVKNASEEPVIDAGARLGIKQKAWPFLPKSSNIVERKALAFVKSLYGKALRSSEFNDLADYLALSTCCHALDGWRYLSQAALSIVSSARNEALHLAYYAELRAALSILAGSGIGVLNNKHFSLTDKMAVEWFGGKTHETTWKTLQEWTNKLSNAMKVVECLGVFEISGDEWAQACGAATSKEAIAQHWLQDWSIDLNSLYNDSDARNEASYRPDLRWRALSPLCSKEIQFIYDVSSSCIPSGFGQFESIDLALIHNLCESACDLIFVPTDPSRFLRLWNEVRRWLINTKSLDDKQALKKIQDIRNAPNSPAGNLLRLADIKNTEVSGVFSRAFLLLRLASALIRRQWKIMQYRAPARTTKGGMIDWQEKLLVNYGIHSNLWSDETALANFYIIDADRQQAQEILDVWFKDKRSFNLRTMWKDERVPNALFQLCRLERMGVMIIAL